MRFPNVLRSVALTTVWILGVVLATPASAGFVTFGNGANEKWDDPTFGTPAIVTWGFMAQGTTLDPMIPVSTEVVGGSDIDSMRAAYNGTYGAGAFDAAIERAITTWSRAANIQFVGPLPDPGLPSGDPAATSPDIRIGAFHPAPGTAFEGLGAVGYGPPFDDANFLDARAGEIVFNLAIPAIQPSGAEDDPIIGVGNDLENLALHELGHAAMGLGHPSTGPGDVMYVGADCCLVINRELSADDITGARIVYGPPVCDDGIDNDGDGEVDLADIGCEDAGDDTETSPTLPCDDGLDNDGDGSVDQADLGCSLPDDPKEDPECQDGIDNDGLLGTDFDGGESVLGIGNGDPQGADPQCLLPSNNQEAAGGPVGCGLGPELALILSLLGLAQARYRSPRPSHEDSGRTK